MEELKKRPDGCPFERLCEECYPEASMAEYRKRCSAQNCRRCYRYREYHEGYHDLDETYWKEGTA